LLNIKQGCDGCVTAIRSSGFMVINIKNLS